jgi:hypothetical protein
MWSRKIAGGPQLAGAVALPQQRSESAVAVLPKVETTRPTRPRCGPDADHPWD